MGEHRALATDRLFFALSHRARRRMLTQLADAGEIRVTDLARRHRMSLNSVSKHVVVLERARLVRRRVAGREHFLRLEPRRLEEAERWLAEQRRFWSERLDGLAAFLEQRAEKR